MAACNISLSLTLTGLTLSQFFWVTCTFHFLFSWKGTAVSVVWDIERSACKCNAIFFDQITQEVKRVVHIILWGANQKKLCRISLAGLAVKWCIMSIGSVVSLKEHKWRWRCAQRERVTLTDKTREWVSSKMLWSCIHDCCLSVWRTYFCDEIIPSGVAGCYCFKARQEARDYWEQKAPGPIGATGKSHKHLLPIGLILYTANA